MSNDLEEANFVSDDGISTVPGPITPAGGAIKKRRADLKKTIDAKAEKVSKPPMHEEDEEDYDSEFIEEEIISIDESLAAMFDGMDLSEEFLERVATVFNAAVNEAASIKALEIVEEIEDDMEDSFQETIDDLVENLDAYLDYIVTEWMDENEVGIESGIKVEMAESLMEGLRELFENHNIEIEGEDLDVISALEQEAEELGEAANIAINENIELRRAISELQAELEFNEVSEDLTTYQKERLRVLAEKLDFSDPYEYRKDLETLKESFFKTRGTRMMNESFDEDEYEDSLEDHDSRNSSHHPSVDAVLQVLNSRK